MDETLEVIVNSPSNVPNKGHESTIPSNDSVAAKLFIKGTAYNLRAMVDTLLGAYIPPQEAQKKKGEEFVLTLLLEKTNNIIQ